MGCGAPLCVAGDDTPTDAMNGGNGVGVDARVSPVAANAGGTGVGTEDGAASLDVIECWRSRGAGDGWWGTGPGSGATARSLSLR